MPANRQLLRLFTSYGAQHTLLTDMTQQEITAVMEKDTGEWLNIRGVRDIDEEAVSCNHMREYISAYYLERWSPALAQQQAKVDQPRLIQ
jgi:hypothetical protein